MILKKNGRCQKCFFRNDRVHLVGFGLLMRLQGSKHQKKMFLIKNLEFYPGGYPYGNPLGIPLKDIHKTPDQPPKRPLCYLCAVSNLANTITGRDLHVAPGNFAQTQFCDLSDFDSNVDPHLVTLMGSSVLHSMGASGGQEPNI